MKGWSQATIIYRSSLVKISHVMWNFVSISLLMDINYVRPYQKLLILLEYKEKTQENQTYISGYLLNQTQNTRLCRIGTFSSFSLNNIYTFLFQWLCKLDLLKFQIFIYLYTMVNTERISIIVHYESQNAVCNLIREA